MELDVAISKGTCLTGMPPELFEKIIADMLDVVGMLKAVRLRIVSKNFDTAIVHAIYESYVHDKDGPVYIQLARRIRIGTSIHPKIMSVFLLAEMEHCQEDHILFPIRNVIEAFYGNEDQEAEYRINHLICEAMSQHLFWGPLRQLGFRVTRHRDGHIKNDPSPVEGESTQIALCMAIVDDNLSMCQSLLSECPNVNFASRHLGRPLQLAVKWASNRLVQLLLDYGAHPNVNQKLAGPRGSLINDHGLYYSTHGSALQVAALAGKEDMVQLLLKPDYSTNLSADDYRQSIECAARIGHIRIFSILIERIRAENSIPELDIQERVFFTACYHGQEELAKLMIHDGVSVHSLSTRLDMTAYPSALQLAAMHGHVNIMRLLLNYGIDLHYSFSGTYRPAIDALTISAMKGYEEAVQILLDHGADLNAKVDGVDLRQVALKGQSRMLDFLIEQGADLNKFSEDGKATVGEKILADAAHSGNLPIVQVLVKAGVPLNNTDQLLDPISNATAYGKAHVLKFLLKSGGQEIDPKDICFEAEVEDDRHLGEGNVYDQRTCHWIGRY